MTDTAPQPPAIPDPDFPFRILRIFFSKVRIERASELPSELALEQLAEVKFSRREEPRQFQVNLRLTTTQPQSSPVTAEIEAIGVFEHVGEGTPTKSSLVHFINNRLLFTLATSVAQLLGATTAQMGMPPIWMPLPLAFGLTESLLDTSNLGLQQ